jgi:uncharacterized protein YsxB (DUF464 family)
MISVTFTESENKLSLRIEGHAGYAEHGKDIVCASASILAYTLASIVDSFTDVESVINLTSGDTTIECICEEEETYTKVANAFHYTQIGYALLEHNYPQYVRLIES